jgi:hypothetical protein
MRLLSAPRPPSRHICQAEDLIDGFSFENLLADNGYDSDRFRAGCIGHGAA